MKIEYFDKVIDQLIDDYLTSKLSEHIDEEIDDLNVFFRENKIPIGEKEDILNTYIKSFITDLSKNNENIHPTIKNYKDNDPEGFSNYIKKRITHIFSLT